MQLTTKSVCKS